MVLSNQRIHCRLAMHSRASPRAVRQLGVIGAGQMGVGIALVAARVARLPVTLVDRDGGQLARSGSFIGERASPLAWGLMRAPASRLSACKGCPEGQVHGCRG